jgi:hypothetical protein
MMKAIGAGLIASIFIFSFSFSSETKAFHQDQGFYIVEQWDPSFLAKQQKSSMKYTHFVELNLYLTPGHTPSKQELKQEWELAQKKLDDCGIYLRVGNILVLEVPQWFREFESLEDHDNHLSRWERVFFAKTPARSAGVIFVESFAWTLEDHGTLAVGYGPYVLRREILEGEESDKVFFAEHMSGHSVLGPYMKKWTFLHELGHSILDLSHVENPRNIMFPRDGKLDPSFTQAQCRKAKRNSPYLKPFLPQQPLHLAEAPKYK